MVIADNMEHYDSFCFADMSVWLNIHYSIVFTILILISNSILVLYPYMWNMIWHWQHYFIDEDEIMTTEGQNASTFIRNLIRIIMTEVKLTFIYIIAALISTYLLNIGSMTQMRLNRWLIEGFYAPMSIFILWYLYFVYYLGVHLYIFNSPCYTHFTSLMKLIMFLLVRYTEFYPSAGLNNRSIKLFYRICNKSDPNNPYYLDQLSLNENKTSIL